jgi:hypothetical protein
MEIGLLWRKLGLDVPTLLQMMKGGLSPTITIAMGEAAYPCFRRNHLDTVIRCQSTAEASVTTTPGYLTALIATVSQCLLPRSI